MKQFTLSSLLLLWCSWQCLASNYYVSTARGDDSRSPLLAQNPQTPWQSITKLNAFFSQLQPGDSILFKRGEVFYGSIQASKSGSAGSPIVLGAFGQGERPVISGFTAVSSWRSVGGGIYESPFLTPQSAVNLVVINEVNHPMGRYPNANAGNKGYLNFESHGTNFIVDNQLTSAINWANAELVVRSTRYTIDRVKISSHSKKQINFKSAIPNGLMDGYGYFVQNHLKTLDQFGEWYYNPSTKKLYVFLGYSNVSNFKVQVGTIDVLIEPKASNLVIDNLTIKGANRYGVFCDWSNLHNLKIVNSQILYSGIDAIQLSGRSNFVLENSTINFSNSKAVNLNYNNPYATVRNNSIRNSGIHPGMIVGQSYGIVNYAKGMVAQNNTIINTGYAGIRFFGDSNLIKNNFIDTFCTILDDGAGIYTWTGGKDIPFFKRSIVGNIVINGLAAPEGTNELNFFPAEGIYLDDNTVNVAIFDNTVANCKNNGIFIHNSRSIQIQNNVLFNNGIQLLSVHDHLAGPVSDLTVTDNQFFSKKQEQVAASYKSLDNDFMSLGNFSGNYYARPFDDDLTIISEYDNYQGNRKKKFYDVKSPQMVTGQNQEAGGSPLRIKPYTAVSVNDNLNKYPNGNFESSPINVYCWSADGECRTTWTTSALDQKSMKITGASSGVLTLDCGAIAKTKQYLLRFSAIGQVESHIEVFLRQSGSPWKTLSTVKTIRITPTRAEYEVLFSFPASETVASIVFQAASENFSYWLDNVKLLETSSVSMTNADDHIRFEYNPSMVNKSIQLGANYLDVEKRAHSGELVLRPFESIVLLKDPQLVPVSAMIASSIKSNFRIQVNECKIALNWGSVVDENLSHFELEKSEDGTNFEIFAIVNKEEYYGFQTFEYIDTPLVSNNHYRLKTVNLDKRFTYSEVLEERVACDSDDSWMIYPTILSKGQSTLSIKMYTDQPTATFTIVDQLGRVIKTIVEQTVSGWNKLNWELPADVASGNYYLVHADGQRKKVLPFMVITTSY